ncbi:MAG: exodeoxyribonuclease III [Nitrospiria bacterium]
MPQIKIATWNVNSIRMRLETVLDWLEKHQPQVLCIQETKTPDVQFPKESFYKLGYEVTFTGQKSYNGMAILSTLPFTDVCFDFAENPDALQKRFMSATLGGIRLINVYFPNGSEVGSLQFAYKLDFIAQLHRHLESSYTSRTPLALVGDFNIAPDTRDVYDPVAMDGKILFHPEERAALATLKAWELMDLFRLHHEEGGQYSWWDYRMNAFRRNIGLRIDHIWATQALAARCIACDIDKGPRTLAKPSDHAPVVATFQI